ncbi:S-adenosyl-L-methionine-dependent methyltransferase [Peziza echinospora]|nr:S-adenosyl-L-methionine-dependent methyltransferase [Peziza echinospora]
MDSAAVSSIFRSLFHQRACLRTPPRNAALFTSAALAGPRLHTRRPQAQAQLAAPQRRAIATKPKEVIWQPRSLHMYKDVSPEVFDQYPMVTAADLVNRTERPRRVKMWARDFIDDSLYNPQYGYFSKHATIFTPGTPFDFSTMEDDHDFTKQLSERYVTFEDNLDATKGINPIRQLWHTPTELFNPYYGHAIARYLVANYKLSLYPYHDLVIYEMGAGNGTLMRNVLDWIRDNDPDVYERTKYRIIEISPALAEIQATTISTDSTTHNILQQAAQSGHSSHVQIINKSIFEWDTYVPDSCFFLALEVFDNFAHDMIRYDPYTSEPLQGMVLIDNEGDFHEFYTRDLDPLVSRFLAIQKRAAQSRRASSKSSALNSAATNLITRPLTQSLAKIKQSLNPFSTNLSHPTYFPTKLLQFFDILHTYFPSHRLVTSDFHSLPTIVKGTYAPVVQTRFNRTTIPVSTIYVHQGYFDILFPTDFALAEDMYRAVTGKLTRVMTHGEFVKRWAWVDQVRTRSGDVPLVTWYENASFLSSV